MHVFHTFSRCVFVVVIVVVVETLFFTRKCDDLRQSAVATGIYWFSLSRTEESGVTFRICDSGQLFFFLGGGGRSTGG